MTLPTYAGAYSKVGEDSTPYTAPCDQCDNNDAQWYGSNGGESRVVRCDNCPPSVHIHRDRG